MRTIRNVFRFVMFLVIMSVVAIVGSLLLALAGLVMLLFGRSIRFQVRGPRSGPSPVPRADWDRRPIKDVTPQFQPHEDT